MHPIRDWLRALKNSLSFGPAIAEDGRHVIDQLAGNHVIMEGDGVYALLAHVAPGSVKVRVGPDVEEGAELGRIGHTGNSTPPPPPFPSDGPGGPPHR